MRNSRNINIFVRVPAREDRVPGRGDREIVYVPNVYVPFPAPKEGLAERGRIQNRQMVSRQILSFVDNFVEPEVLQSGFGVIFSGEI